MSDGIRQTFLRWCCFVVCLLANGSTFAADPILAGTALLEVTQPLDELMVAGLRRYCLRELAAARVRRAEHWNRDDFSVESQIASAPASRDRFRTLIGAVDRRLTLDANGSSRFELLTTLETSSVVAHSSKLTVHAVRWPVLEGVTTEGLLLVPKIVRAGVVALPDADWTPEMFCGVHGGLPESAQIARSLAEAGCLVAIPMLISRSNEFSGNPLVTYTNQTHREFLYRQAFEAGRHIIGYEVQKVLAAVDLLEQHVRRQSAETVRAPFSIGVVGVGEGGLLALASAALDERIQACWVGGYFQERERLWQEPIDRNVWGLLTEFGDAELAGLIAPRRLVIEACGAVEVGGPPAVREGRRASASPGRISNCSLPSVRSEFERATTYYRQMRQLAELVLAVSGPHSEGPAGTAAARMSFLEGLKLKEELPDKPEAWQMDASHVADPAAARRRVAAREQRQFEELQVHVQSLLRRSHQVRDAKWRLNPKSVEDWERLRIPLRNSVHDELIGRLPGKRLPFRPRTRRVLETETYVGYEVLLDVVEDIVASGLLLVPKKMAAGEKRPVVVCQHGLEGTPLDTVTCEPPGYTYYKAFSEELVQRGFIVFAPQNPYRGGHQFRELQRMSNPLQRTLFTYIVAQHEQTLDWLATLPQVDERRIAFYGLSYGGKTAMRVPPLVDRYCLSICSGDFTDWPLTIASNEERFSYLFTTEYETPEWNLAHVASYAELAMLMAPRPFMVEEGHRDGGQPSEWVAGEFGKVRRHYDQLQIGDRAELEFFDGPHTIHGQGTYRFLHRHLNWPEPISK